MKTLTTKTTTARFYLAAILLSLGLVLALTACGDAHAEAPAGLAALPKAGKIASDTLKAPAETAAEATMEVLHATACTGIAHRAPVNSGTEFDAEVGKVWIYTQVELPQDAHATIQHIYFLDGNKIQTVDLDVEGPRYRTRSFKTIRDGMHGDWKVEIRSAQGELLDTVNFSVDQ